MNPKLSPKQALFVWKMITAETPDEREPLKSKARPDLGKERDLLIEGGFLRLESRPGKRGKYLVLTDRAWAWAADAMDVELMKSNSRIGAEALQGLLRRLLPFLKERNLPLASLFSTKADPNLAPEKVFSKDEEPASPSKTSSADQHAPLPALIEAACLSLAGRTRKTRVRLSALRQRLPSVERSALDEALLSLQDQGRLVLYRDDNSASLTDEDHLGALIVGGAPRHLVLLED